MRVISRSTRSARTRQRTTPGARRSRWIRPSAGSRPISPTSRDMESQKKHPRTFSFEFFPPKTPEGMDKLRATWRQLAQLKPRFFSCTYGAGGSTRERTLETVLEIQAAGHRGALGFAEPIGPGIMPTGNFSQLARFSDACGAEIPRWLRLKMQGFGDDLASIRSLGLDGVTELCDRLLSAGAPGLHFYTMNQAELASTIWQRLGI